MTFYAADLLLTFAAGQGNTAKFLLYALCKVRDGRLCKNVEGYATLCKMMQVKRGGGVVYEIIVLPLGYSINLLTFGSYVEMVRLFVKMTVLLMISLKLEHTVST